MGERKAVRAQLAQEPMDLAAAPIVVGTPDHTSTGGRAILTMRERNCDAVDARVTWTSIQLTQPGSFPRAEFERDLQIH
jgi:hypothetical protein